MATPDENAGLDEEFIAGQRERLENMLDHYRGDQGRPEDGGLEVESFEATATYGDDADDAAEQAAIESRPDFDITSDAESERHIEAIRRALEKIDEGSYGLSDDSGEPIGRAHLESVPEARYTRDEEAQRGSELAR